MATVAPLNTIKSSIASLLDSANTTTATPIDLSSGLANSKRVKRVMSVHPDKIIPQASFFPLVTCYVESKTIRRDDIAKSQLDVKRRSTITVNVVGTVWNDNYQSANQDPADEDINTLMENVELILRSSYNISGVVTWQFPNEVQYYSTTLNEQTHLRSGILKLECEVFY